MCTQHNVIEALREAEAALELAIKRILKRDPGHHVEVTSEAKALVSVRQALQCQGCDVPKDGVYQISEPSHSMSQYASKDDMLRAVMAENERLKAQLAAAQQGAQDAEPAAWVATFKPEGLLALHSVVGANLEELKQSVPGNSVFRPLYTHPTPQGLDVHVQNRLDRLYLALEVCSAELFAQCAHQGRAMKYVDQARYALAAEQCARATQAAKQGEK